VQFGADAIDMNKHTARLMPLAIASAGLVAALGGFFGTR